MPKHAPCDYTPEFVSWIDSINEDFRTKEYYKPFDLYVMQARVWMEESIRIQHIEDTDEQQAYIDERKIRCEENSLYAANWQGWLKEGSVREGWIKFSATEAQEILHFLVDSGYSALIVKGRQIGFTSDVGLIAANDLNVRKNYFTKLITHDINKGIEIFQDKIYEPFSQIESWFRSRVANSSKRELRTGFKDGKIIDGRNSKIYVGTPSEFEINGGSPQRVLLDEIGMFEPGMFSKMINQARPAMYFLNPDTGVLELVRQIIGWGTGGDMDKGGADLENEFKAALEQWKKGNYSHGMIPLFFSFWARRGASQELYDKEKEFYYSKNDPKQEIIFHQSFPLSIEDVFLRNKETLISLATINKMHLRTLQMPPEEAPQYGYFKPIFDTNIQYHEEMKVPHPIVGAEWIPTRGLRDPLTTGVMRRQHQNWKNRYYQGIDPINSETGHSKFAATIWDKELCEISHEIFYRERDFKMCYLQALLQRIYYSGKGRMIPWLLENNIGDDCFQFYELLGYGKGYVPNLLLPPALRSVSNGGKHWGISKKTNNSGRIVESLHDMLDKFHQNILILTFWLSMKTFVEIEVNSQTHRQTRFGPQNKHKDFDDNLDSATFAYIASDCYRWVPESLDVSEDNVLPKLKRVRENGQVVLRYVNKAGRVVGAPKKNNLPGF